MRRLIPLAGAIGLLVAAGCAGGGASRDTDGSPPAKRSPLTRFTFKDEAPSNRETGAPLPETAPGGDLIGADGKPTGVANYRGKPLVLVFNRGFAGYICPTCTTYTAQLSTHYADFKAAGAELLVVYPTREEDREQVAAFVASCNEILAEEGEAGLQFPVALDPGLKVVHRYNIEGDLSLPSTFVLGPDGVVCYAYVGQSPTDRPDAQRVLAEVRALQSR